LKAPSWEGTQLVGQRHLGVDAVQLDEVDPVELQVPQRQLHLLLEVGGASHRVPLPRAGADQARLGADHQLLRVRVQRLGDDLLADEGAVGVGGVDEVDALLDGRADDAHGGVVVDRLAPDAGAGELHGAVAEPVDGQIPTDAERVCGCDRGHGSSWEVGVSAAFAHGVLCGARPRAVALFPSGR
jgi:hypothetical protein